MITGTLILALMAPIAELPSDVGESSSEQICASEGEDQASAALQGTWNLVSATAGGREAPAETGRTIKLVIAGNKYAYHVAGTTFNATFKVDATKDPKHLDATFEDGPRKGMTMLSIYAVEGDKLRICGGDKRPTEFGSPKGSNAILFVYQREKPR